MAAAEIHTAETTEAVVPTNNEPHSILIHHGHPQHHIGHAKFSEVPDLEHHDHDHHHHPGRQSEEREGGFQVQARRKSSVGSQGSLTSSRISDTTHHRHRSSGSRKGKMKKRLIDILNPKKEPLPVELPPVSQHRRAGPPLELPSGGPKKPGYPHSGSIASSTPSLLLQGRRTVPFVEGDDDPNPFTYPTSIEEFREHYEAEREEEKRTLANTPALMKGTNQYKQSQTILRRIKPFMQPSFKPSLAHDYKQVVWRAQNGLHINHLQKVSRKLHTEYIMERKKIFYLRRDIRTRKVAIEMISKTREFEEACLKDYEWLTEFTKEAFDAFLKENDEKTHEAEKRVSLAQETKLEKTLQLHQLNKEIEQLKGDITATNDELRECKSYMRFLDGVAKEVMRKDEEEEIRAQFREQQIKEELVTLIEQGKSFREAKKMVEARARLFEELPHLEEEEEEGSSLGEKRGPLKEPEEKKQNEQGTPESKGERKTSGASPQDLPPHEQEGEEEAGPEEGQEEEEISEEKKTDFLEDLYKKVRRFIGMPDEPIEIPDPRKSKDLPKEKKNAYEVDYVYESPPSPSSEINEDKTVLSPRTLVASMVPRQKSRLVQLLEPHEIKFFQEVIMGEPMQCKLRIEDANKHTDEDGYNEYQLMKSLNLVPGDEETDRRELANLRFTKPSQLLQIFADMEEANRTMEKHVKVSGEILDKLNNKIVTTRKQLNERGRVLRTEINRIQNSIDASEERANALATLIEMFTGGNYDVKQQQKLYKILKKQIAKVYQATVGTVDHHLNSLMMLTSIEKNFEALMSEIRAMPNDVVVQISKELDKERREMERVEKMGQRKALQDAKRSRALSRATAPIHRRKGRPLVARSRPPKITLKLTQAEVDKEAEEEEYNYFFGP